MRLVNADDVKQVFQKHGATDDFEAVLDTVPTIDPVKHGKWIIIEYEYLTCSICRWDYYTGADSRSDAQEIIRNGSAPKYCPHCGAKMDL